jgi:alanyl-tRNA synthetase
MLSECCKKLLNKPIFIFKNNKIMISGELSFHLFDTHGIPLEIIEYGFNRKYL